MRTHPGKCGKGIRGSTQENYFGYLVGLFRWTENPVVVELETSRIVRLPRREPPEVVVLSETELERLQNRLEAMPGWNGCVARFMVAMYAYTGLRRSELRLANMADLDTKNWRIKVVHSKVQSGWLSPAAVVTILPPARKEVMDFLKERKKYLLSHGLRECKPLIPRVLRDGSVGYWTDAMWGKVKGEAQRQAGVSFQIRHLRATFAQMCRDRGASIEAVSRVLRHRSILTTEVYYARMRPDDAFRELEKLFPP
jgi:integrase